MWLLLAIALHTSFTISVYHTHTLLALVFDPYAQHLDHFPSSVHFFVNLAVQVWHTKK